MAELAINGGRAEIPDPLTPYNTIGPDETRAALAVMESGVLSGFLGAPSDAFYGGPKVRALEAAWRELFGVKHAVSLNSATSGLFAAMGAVGIGPGDEVIVPPYTMSATAMAPIIYGGIPVFADIDDETYNLDPVAVERVLTPRTKAILAVNIMGHAAKLHELRALADRHGLYLVEDNAQGLLATEMGRYSGTVGHIGVFSLNRHKHIQAGEGGICTTEDDNLATRLALIRNHGENLVDHLEIDEPVNIVGFNYRLPELSAAIALAQLDRAAAIVDRREAVALRLSRAVTGLPGLTPPATRADCRHVYYMWGSLFDETTAGVPRKRIAEALRAEGVPVGEGYVKPLYFLPMFRDRRAIGAQGFPFNQTNRTYQAGLCPTCEELHTKRMLSFESCSYELSDDDLDRIAAAFHKVWDQRHTLVN